MPDMLPEGEGFDMRTIFIAALLTVVPAVAQAQSTPQAAPAPAAASAGYNTTDTDLGTLLDDPAAKAVLAKHIPAVIASEQIDMARGLTLKALQNYSPDKLSDEVLSKIDVDLAKLPAKK